MTGTHSADSPVTIGVGIVGLSASGGWAAMAHVPALSALPQFELRAASASSPESARRAAEKFDVPYAAVDSVDLARRDDVDLVVIAVKVPRHYDLVMSALDAGKDVYCEWPLGNGADEAARLTEAADRAGRRVFVGLQARSSPTIRFVRDLIANGYIGRPLSTTLIGSGGQWGKSTDSGKAYLSDARSGASMLTIPFGHTLDALTFALGEVTELSAVQAIQRPEIVETDTGKTVKVDVSDQIAVVGKLDSGVVMSVHFRGGMTRATNLLWEINGTEGDLVLHGDTGHLQMATTTLHGATGNGKPLAALTVPDSYHLAPQFPDRYTRALNVANAYAQVHHDLTLGTTVVPDFRHSLKQQRMLDKISRTAPAWSVAHTD